MTFLWLIGSLLLDFSIAVTLLGHLRTVPSTPLVVASALPPPSSVCPSTTLQRVPRPRAPLLSRLLTTILTTFSLTAILMFSLLILVLAMHGTEFDAELPEATGIFTALRLLATPIYAVTFLYTLNRRHWKESTLDRPATSEQHFPLGICEAQSAPYALQTERHFDKAHLNSGNQENWVKLQRLLIDLRQMQLIAFLLFASGKPTFFTVLPPSKSKTTDTKNRKKCTSQNLKTDLLSPLGQKFKKVGSCGPFRTTLSDSSWLQPSVAQAPSPVHTVENQREIGYHTSRTFSIQSHCAALNDMGIEEAPPIHAGGMSVPYCPGTAL
ncbi:hypothetical protein O181_030636 [Austropuccinia psidii MF-1]|uniref:Uncharacterized protein n=1 Tax=Austropuccinia psidii MF-1 TaxID=1389203 RepID=A0A9Q3CTC4_9BASI|nr:hypothetical protein [Austropuccinia psidii MF-1]